MTRRRRADRLLDIPPPPTPQLSPCLDLEAIHPDHCPACGGPTRTTTHRQAALFYFAGYGGLEGVTRRTCPTCLWSIVSHHTTSNPRR